MDNAEFKNEPLSIPCVLEPSQSGIMNFTVKLIFDMDCDEHELSLPPNHQERIFTLPSSTIKQPFRKKSVSFNDNVTVIFIPRRKDYSKGDSSQLWCRAKDLHIMVQRNQIEFAAEGWDCHRVLEEDQMYFCESTREFVHPVHVSLAPNQTY